MWIDLRSRTYSEATFLGSKIPDFDRLFLRTNKIMLVEIDRDGMPTNNRHILDYKLGLANSKIEELNLQQTKIITKQADFLKQISREKSVSLELVKYVFGRSVLLDDRDAGKKIADCTFYRYDEMFDNTKFDFKEWEADNEHKYPRYFLARLYWQWLSGNWNLATIVGKANMTKKKERSKTAKDSLPTAFW